VADRELIHTEQIRHLPQSCRREAKSGSRRPESVAKKRVNLDNGLQGVWEELKSESWSAARM